VFRTRDALVEAIEFEFADRSLIGESFSRFVDVVFEVLPGKPVERFALEESLRHVVGVKLTKDLIASVSWRIAGNLPRLRARRAVPPWHVQRFPEWVPAHIVSCRRSRNKSNEFGGLYGFRILAGTPASLTCYRWWSKNMAGFLAGNHFGFAKYTGRRSPAYDFLAPEQLVGLRLLLLIDPDVSGQEPGFSKVYFVTQLRKWNQTTLRCRARDYPGFTCLKQVSDEELPCFRCPVGFTRCRAATHRTDWIVRPCPVCEKTSMFDDELDSKKCLDCFAAEAARRMK
jgi:hypothetical protein